MKTVCLLLIGLSAASAVPFFGREVLGPEPVFLPPVAEPAPFDNYEVPPGQAFHFAFQMPQIDLSNIFKPLRLFAGVNLPAVQQEQEERRQCHSQRFELSEPESRLVTGCQERDVGGSLLTGNDQLKQCIVNGLPDSSIKLRKFLDREEYALVSLNSAYSISFVDGNFEQKRSITFQLCPKDELNSIDGEVPAPDRIDTEESAAPVELVVPAAAAPETPLLAEEPERPLFQFGIPQLQLPDFGELFQPLFSLVPELTGPAAPAEPGPLEAPAPTESPAAGGDGVGGFLSDLFSIFHPPVRTDIDVHDCANKRFDVLPEVYEKANECKHDDDYKSCLSKGIEANKANEAFLDFTTSPEWEIVGSSFTRATFTYIDETTTRNTIYVKRCRKIELEKNTSAVEESTEESSGVAAEETSIQEDVLVPAEILPEEQIIESKIDGQEEPSAEASHAPVVPEVGEPEPAPVEASVPEVEDKVIASAVEETAPPVDETDPVIKEEAAEDMEVTKEQVEAEKASSEVEVLLDSVEVAGGYAEVAAPAEPLKQKPAE